MALRTLLISILAASSAFAQMSVFPKPSYFREAFKKPDTKVELQPPVRLSDFVKRGSECAAVVVEATKMQDAETAKETGRSFAVEKPGRLPETAPDTCLVLSLNDYLALVMANHTDVQSYRLTLERAQNSVTSQYGAWDPSASASLSPSWSRRDPKLNDPYGNKSRTAQWPISLSFSQSLPTGQSISIGGGGSKSGSWGQDTNYSSNMSFSVTQPLIRNRGSYINRVSLMQAQSSLRVSEHQFRQNLLNLVNSAESAYWSAISAREQLRVSLTARDVSQANLNYINEELRLGAVSPLELYRPEQSRAQADLNVVQQQFTLRNTTDALRRQIGADLDPNIRDLAIVLTDSPELSPAEKIVPDREQTVAKAMNLSPSMKIALQNLDADELGLASARNGLLPRLDLTAGYSGSGAGQTFIPSEFLGEVGGVVPGGLGDALHQMFGWGNPTYSVSLRLTLPIRSRSASVAMANALIAKKQDTLSLRSQQQSLRLSTLQALNSFDGAVRSLEMATLSREYAGKDYDAQKLRFTLGMSTQLELIQAAQQLANSDTSLVTAQINVRTSLLRLWLQTGELLDQRNIAVK